jgi:hypothetical protein
MLHDFVSLAPGDVVLQNGANSAVRASTPRHDPTRLTRAAGRPKRGPDREARGRDDAQFRAREARCIRRRARKLAHATVRQACG